MQHGGNRTRRRRRSPHGERGLKYTCKLAKIKLPSRSPHGERGLKFDTGKQLRPIRRRSPHGERGLKSAEQMEVVQVKPSLPTRGAWIEIYRRCGRYLWASRRSPHGERGLKSTFSAPNVGSTHRRSPHGERGLKFPTAILHTQQIKSLPTRGAWIEI